MVSLSQKGHEEDEDISSFWLITYSDMVTLLLTFFLLMYSFSVMSQDRKEELVENLRGLDKNKAQQVQTPVAMLLVVPVLCVQLVASDPRGTAAQVLTMVPFSAPVGMPMRVFLGTAEWGEPFVSLAILLATTALAVLVGERIYRNSLLKTGARVPLGEALRG